jgi:WD40 repeat protein
MSIFKIPGCFRGLWTKVRHAYLHYSLVSNNPYSCMLPCIAMATKSDPSTGKTERTAMFGHEDAVPSPVSSMKMDSHQIIWGHFDGHITITTRTMSTSGRQLKRFMDWHEGPVTAVTTSSSLHNAVLSGGQDGVVKVWDIGTGYCVGDLLGEYEAPAQ